MWNLKKAILKYNIHVININCKITCIILSFIKVYYYYYFFVKKLVLDDRNISALLKLIFQTKRTCRFIELVENFTGFQLK